jgi:hypothetical protein
VATPLPAALQLLRDVTTQRVPPLFMYGPLPGNGFTCYNNNKIIYSSSSNNSSSSDTSNSNNSRSSSTVIISVSLSTDLFIYLSGIWALGVGFALSFLRLTDEYVTTIFFSSVCNPSFSKSSFRHFMLSQEVTLDTVPVLLRPRKNVTRNRLSVGVYAHFSWRSWELLAFSVHN